MKRWKAGDEYERTHLRRVLARWKSDPKLALVRDAPANGALSEAERASWTTLWNEVDARLAEIAR
jgi:hypothetical protein